MRRRLVIPKMPPTPGLTLEHAAQNLRAIEALLREQADNPDPEVLRDAAEATARFAEACEREAAG